MYVKNVDAVQKEKVGAGLKTFKQVLIGPDEAPDFAMRRFIIEPGGEMPKHTNSVEHEQYVLNGMAEIGIGDEIFKVKTNDVVYIPAEIPHWYKVVGDDPFEFLCVVPNKSDVMKLL